MRRTTALVLGVLWLLALVGVDSLVSLRKANVKHHIDSILLDSIGKIVSYQSLEGGLLGPFTLTEVYVTHQLDSDIMMTISEVQFQVNWWGFLTEKRPLSYVLLKQPVVRLRWNSSDELELSPIADAPDTNDDTIGILPAIELEGLTLVFVNPPYLLKDDTTFELKTLNVSLAPDIVRRGAYRFAGELSDPVLGDWTLQGVLDGSDVEVGLTRSTLKMSKELVRTLSPDIGEPMEHVTVEGQASLVAHLEDSSDHPDGLWTMRADFDGARIGYGDWKQTISDLHGSIVYEKGMFRCQEITGVLEGGAFRVQGTFDLTGGHLSTDLEGDLFSLPVTDEFVRRISELPFPGDEIGEQLERWKARGPADLSFRLKKDDTQGAPVRPYLDVTLKENDLIWMGSREPDGVRRGFHYQLHKLRGQLEITPSVLKLKHVSAMNGLMTLDANGQVNFDDGEEETFYVVIDSKGLEVDEAILEALPEGTREVLEPLHIEGSVDLVLRPMKEKEREEPDVPEMAIQLNEIAVRPDVFPLRIEDLKGLVRLKDPYVFIEQVRGVHGDGILTVDGRVRIDEGLDTLIRIEATNLPFDRDLLKALAAIAPDTETLFSRLETHGTIDVERLEIVQTDERPDVVVSGIVKLAGARFKDLDSPLEVEFVSGGLRFENDSLKLLPDTVVSLRGINLSAQGTYSPEKGYHLLLDADELALDKRFMELLSIYIPALGGMDEVPDIGGLATIELKIDGTPESGKITGKASFREVRLDPKTWQDARVEDLSCDVDIDFETKTATLDNLVARIPVPPDIWSGPLRDPTSAERRFDERAEISVQVQHAKLNFETEAFDGQFDRVRVGGIPLHSWFLSLCGLNASEIDELNLPQMTGSASLNFQTVDVRNDTLTASVGEVGLSGLQLGSDADVFMKEAKISDVSVIPTPDGGIAYEGKLSASNLRLFSVPVPRLEGSLTGGGNGFRLRGITGDLFGYRSVKNEKGQFNNVANGVISEEDTNFAFFWDPGRFDLAARFDSINLAEAVRAWGTDPGNVRGAARFQGILSGAFRDSATYEGEGTFHADALYLLELPMFLRMLNVLTLFRPTDLLASSPKTKVYLNYMISDQMVRLKDVALEGNSLDLKGKGVITFDGIVKVSLNATHKSGVPFLSWILGIIPGVLLGGVEISGPIENPKITGTSLGGGDSGFEVPKGRVPVTKPPKW